MQLTRQQRISLTGISIIDELNRAATQYRKILTSGLDVPAQEGLPALKSTGEEVKAALGENLGYLESILALILDPKPVDTAPE